jgi:integrase
MREKLTDGFAKRVTPTPGKNDRYFDMDKRAPRGFLLRVTPAGARAWALQYRVKSTSRQREISIGDVASWPIMAARERAAELRREIDAGGDPLGDLETKRAAPTVAELAARFIEEALPSRAPRTREEYSAMLASYILPTIGRKKVAAVELADLERLHRSVTNEGKPRRANAVLTIAHVLFEAAIRWKMRTDNPAKRIERNTEHPRERYLSGEEIERLMTALDRWQPTWPASVDAIRLLLLTGARRGEVLGMAWDHVDLDAGVWSKPPAATKQRRSHRVPLSPEAVELLRGRHAERDGRVVSLRRDDRVFRGEGRMEFKLEHHWRVIRAAAGIEDVRLHDLRHSYASLLVNQGYSLPMIGALLGHSEAATTNRYVHLYDKELREATASVGKIVGGRSPK